MSVTTVTAEPRFSESDREALWALWADELERCPECGNPRSVCSQRDAAWYPQRNVCWATAARNVAQRRFDALHKDAKPDDAGYLPDDGVNIWVAADDLTPGDDFLES